MHKKKERAPPYKQKPEGESLENENVQQEKKLLANWLFEDYT